MFTNVHKHRNPKNTKHLRHPFLVQVRNFYLPFWVEGFSTCGKRDTQFLSMLTFPSNPTTCGTPLQTTGLASASSENQLPASSVESLLTVFFFKFQNPQPIASGHDVIHVPGPISYLRFLLWHLCLSHPPRTRVNTCTQYVHLTNPCTKPKGSQPN